MDMKCQLSLKSDIFASLICIGHCSDSVAESTGRRSIVVRNTSLESSGTRCGAAGHDAHGQGLMNPIFANCEIDLSKHLL